MTQSSDDDVDRQLQEATSGRRLQLTAGVGESGYALRYIGVRMCFEWFVQSSGKKFVRH